MNADKQHPKLEDILGEDHITSNQSNDPAQQELADATRRMILQAGNESWDPADKEQLWAQIASGLIPVRFSYRRLLLRVAAALLLLGGLGTWLCWPHQQQNNLVQFALTQPVSENNGDTRLLLGKNAVVVKGHNSSLVYGNNQVTINADSTAQPTAAYNTLLVPYGRRSKVQLEDGTVVQLNAGSRLVYPSSFDKNKREVFLEGEAFFEVAPNAGAPFFVYTSNMETEVLGTSFNISAYKDDTRKSIVLVTGSVQLNLPQHMIFEKSSRQLKPGEMATLGEKLAISKVDVAAYIAWKDGRLLFSGTPLKDILRKLTRYYNIELVLDSTQPGLETCSGDLDLENNLDDVLDVICGTNSLQYEHKGQRVILKEKD